MNSTSMETINWKVEGMSCSACAQTVEGFLEKKGMQEVSVSLTAGEVSFQHADPIFRKRNSKKEFRISDILLRTDRSEKKPVNKFLLYLAVCIPFTLLLHIAYVLALATPALAGATPGFSLFYVFRFMLRECIFLEEAPSAAFACGSRI